MVRSKQGATHRCRNCGHIEPGRIIERPWELLIRCPQCDAYDWDPEPETSNQDSVRD